MDERTIVAASLLNIGYDHMPYLPYVGDFHIQQSPHSSSPVRFPPTWPVYTPAQKMANWLEYYAEAMELPVWMSSSIVSTFQGSDNKWCVKIRRGDSTEREFIVNHLVFATGLGGNTISTYDYPGIVRDKERFVNDRIFSF